MVTQWNSEGRFSISKITFTQLGKALSFHGLTNKPLSHHLLLSWPETTSFVPSAYWQKDLNDHINYAGTVWSDWRIRIGVILLSVNKLCIIQHTFALLTFCWKNVHLKQTELPNVGIWLNIGRITGGSIGNMDELAIHKLHISLNRA